MAVIFAFSASVIFYILSEFFLNLLFAPRLRVIQRLAETENLGAQTEGEEHQNFAEQILQPMLNRVLEVFEIFIPQNVAAMERVTLQLKQAGVRTTARRYVATVMFRVLMCMLLFFVLGYYLGVDWAGRIFFIFFGGLTGLVFSRFSLRQKIDMRKREIYHQLPDVMDLLSVSVAAGLGFDQAVAYVVEKAHGPLIEEMDIMRRELLLGRNRKEAMTNFATRCDNMEIRTFVSTVLQAEEMGSAMQNVLMVQASTIRETHKQNVEEAANKLPVKMLIPLVFFILPVLFIVLLGPAVITIVGALGSGGVIGG